MCLTTKEKKKHTSVVKGERPGLGNRQGRFAETAMSGEQEVSKETHFNRRLPLVVTIFVSILKEAGIS